MNPYETTPPADSEPKRRSGIWQFVIAFILTIGAVMVAAPGLMYLRFLGDVRVPVGRRYATYDSELSLFGIPITPTVAQILTMVVAPFLLVLSLFLVYRGLRASRV